MWDVLGLEPTTDQGAVRKAYAARLKQIDIDRDPSAFIRLRQAYEGCLNWEEPGIQDGQRAAMNAHRAAPQNEPVLQQGSSLVQDPADAKVEADSSPSSAAGFQAAFDEALSQGRFRSLVDLYREGLVAGSIPLGQEAAAHAAVVAVGAADLQTPFADVRGFAEDHAWGSQRPGWRRKGEEYGEAYAARLEAEDWFAGQLALSRQRPDWFSIAVWFFTWPSLGAAPSRLAKTLLGQLGPWRLSEDDAPLLKAALDAWRRHAPYLGERFDPAQAERLDKRLAFLTRKGFWMNSGRLVRWLLGVALRLIFALFLFTAVVAVMLWLIGQNH